MPNRIPTRARVPLSASKANKFDLSSRHIGTTNFGELKPIYCESVIPSDRCFKHVGNLKATQSSNCVDITSIIDELGKAM